MSKPKTAVPSTTIIADVMDELGFTECNPVETSRQYGAETTSGKRRTWKRGTVRVLSETRDCAWWTVQEMRGSNVRWYLDIPLDAGVEFLRDVAFLLLAGEAKKP